MFGEIVGIYVAKISKCYCGFSIYFCCSGCFCGHLFQVLNCCLKKTFVLTVKDSCVPNPCNNEAICTEMDDGYHCTCKLGYKGDQCQSKRISYSRDIWSATKIAYLLICLHKQTRFVKLTLCRHLHLSDKFYLLGDESNIFLNVRMKDEYKEKKNIHWLYASTFTHLQKV